MGVPGTPAQLLQEFTHCNFHLQEHVRGLSPKELGIGEDSHCQVVGLLNHQHINTEFWKGVGAVHDHEVLVLACGSPAHRV